MNWSYEDNKICSRAVIEYFVTGKNAPEISDVISLIKTQCPHLREESIKMKLQNIKYLLEKWYIPNSLTLSPLENASEDSIKALDECLKEFNVSFNL